MLLLVWRTQKSAKDAKSSRTNRLCGEGSAPCTRPCPRKKQRPRRVLALEGEGVGAVGWARADVHRRFCDRRLRGGGGTVDRTVLLLLLLLVGLGSATVAADEGCERLSAAGSRLVARRRVLFSLPQHK